MDNNDRRGILLVRLIHGFVAIFFLTCVGMVYYSGITGRVGLASYLAVLALLVEGIVVLLNKGNCPMGMIHRRVGDPKTLLELFLPPRLAKKGIPFAAFVAFIGFLLLLFRTLDTV